MDPHTFDELTRILARASSRRRALRGLAVGAASALLGSHIAARAQPRDCVAECVLPEPNPGNRECACFCRCVFPPGPDRGRCTSDGAQGRGLCYECGPEAPAPRPPLCGTVCCRAGQLCCSGRCVASDPRNCGRCGNDCAAAAPPNTVPTGCSGGVCQYACAPGFADCDGNVGSNGCETKLGTDTNCAGCGDRCPAGQTCQSGACRCPDGSTPSGGHCPTDTTGATLEGSGPSKREHCTATSAVLTAIGRRAGRQIRVRDDSTGERALYTVAGEDTATPGAVVRTGTDGRARLGTAAAPGDSLTVDRRCVSLSQRVDTSTEACPPPGVTTPEETAAKAAGEFIELLCDDRANGGLIVTAPHGGLIEAHTDRQAKRVVTALATAGRRASLWLCQGWDGAIGAFKRWHITSTDINPESFPGLGSVFAAPPQFAHAVSFHGFDAPDPRGPHVCIGGTAGEALKRGIRDAIVAVLPPDMAVEVYTPATASSTCAAFAGADPNNIVNRLGAEGIQIEQSKAVRDSHGDAIADAVVGVYEPLLPSP